MSENTRTPRLQVLKARQHRACASCSADEKPCSACRGRITVTLTDYSGLEKRVLAWGQDINLGRVGLGQTARVVYEPTEDEGSTPC